MTFVLEPWMLKAAIVIGVLFVITAILFFAAIAATHEDVVL